LAALRLVPLAPRRHRIDRQRAPALDAIAISKRRRSRMSVAPDAAFEAALPDFIGKADSLQRIVERASLGQADRYAADLARRRRKYHLDPQ
jgi:soluble cytochrome b562